MIKLPLRSISFGGASYHLAITTPTMSFVFISSCLGEHDIVLMSPNSGAALDAVLQEEALDAVLQEEAMSNEQLLNYEQEGPDQAENAPPVLLSATEECEDDGAAAAILTTGEPPAGRTTESDTIIVSTPPPVVEKGKRKYRISPHPLKGTEQFDNNVKNHYTEILK